MFNSIMHWTLLSCATLAALLMMTACASESQITAPRAYAPTERLDDLANEETAKRKARERVQADVDRMIAERTKPRTSQ
jgi:hypothetical protein